MSRYVENEKVPCACRGNFDCVHTQEGSDCEARVDPSSGKKVVGFGFLCGRCYVGYLRLKKYGSSHREEMESVLRYNRKQIDRIRGYGNDDRIVREIAKLQASSEEIERNLRLEDALRSAMEG